MTIKLKCKIKSMRVEKQGKYIVEIHGVDNVTVCNKQYCAVVDKNSNNVFLRQSPIKANTKETIFNFISVHSRDTFIMELEEITNHGNSDNKSDNKGISDLEVSYDGTYYTIESAEVTYG